MTALRVARIAYLNTDPFFAEWNEPGATLVSATPRALADAAEQGAIDAGAMPVVRLWKLSGLYEPLGNLGISAPDEAGSVILFLRRPIRDAAPRRVGLTSESVTSVRLVRALVEERFGLSSAFGPFSDDDDGRLVIGDGALKPQSGFPERLDLGAVWREWTGKPFVFARWAVRKDLDRRDKDRLFSALDRSLSRFEADPSGVAAAGARRLGIDEAAVLRYLGGLRYRLGPREDDGENTFRTLYETKFASAAN